MRENLLGIIEKINTITGKPLEKKQLQKVIYLLQAKGIDLGYEFDIFFYGPYSEDLRYDLNGLYLEGDIEYQLEGYTHLVVPYRKAKIDLSPEAIEQIEFAVNTYNDTKPAELELFTTAHFVAVNLGQSNEEIFNGVKRIKGKKFSKKEIKQAITYLRDNNFIQKGA